MACTIFANGYRAPEFYIFKGSPNTPVPKEYLNGANFFATAVHTECGNMDTAAMRFVLIE